MFTLNDEPVGFNFNGADAVYPVNFDLSNVLDVPTGTSVPPVTVSSELPFHVPDGILCTFVVLSPGPIANGEVIVT
jgi:hypothetical protein